MGVPLRLARHSFCGDIEVNAVQSLLSPETTVMGHGGCRLLREALFRRCLYRVSGSCYLQPREEGHGLGWVQGSAGDSMRRVAARRALTAHLGHRPGTWRKQRSAGGAGLPRVCVGKRSGCPSAYSCKLRAAGLGRSPRGPRHATPGCRPRPLPAHSLLADRKSVV